MKRLIKLVKISVVSLAAAFSLGATVYALPTTGVASVDSSRNAVCAGVDATGTAGCGGSAAAAGSHINNLIQNIINLLSGIVGVIAVIMIIVGGMKYITSGGDSSKVASAKSSVIYAIVGLILVALAQVIVKFTLGKV